MKINVQKPSRKIILIVVVVALSGIAAGAGATYKALENDINKNTPRIDTGAQRPEGSPVPVADEQNVPEGTISPNTLITDLGKYVGQTVKVRGQVIESEKDKYTLLGLAGSERRGVPLQLDNTSPDIKPFISGTFDENRTSEVQTGNVTVTVYVQPPADKEPAKFIVKSVER